MPTYEYPEVVARIVSSLFQGQATAESQISDHTPFIGISHRVLPAQSAVALGGASPGPGESSRYGKRGQRAVEGGTDCAEQFGFAQCQPAVVAYRVA